MTTTRLPTISGNERRACIILEDACCRLADDLVTELANLPEFRASGLLRSWCADISQVFRARRQSIRRNADKDADPYEAGVCRVVDLSEPHLSALRMQMQADLVQYVPWQHIRRCTLISAVYGLLDIAGRMHRMLDGSGWRYDEARQALSEIDRRTAVELLNDNPPDCDTSRQRFEALFRELAANVVRVFGRENWREEVTV